MIHSYPEKPPEEKKQMHPEMATNANRPEQNPRISPFPFLFRQIYIRDRLSVEIDPTTTTKTRVILKVISMDTDVSWEKTGAAE